MFKLDNYIGLLSKDKYEEANKYRIENMPKVIYKYISLKSINFCQYSRSCDIESEENNKKINSIRDNKIWLSTYSNLNDPFELSALYVDEQKLQKYNWPIDEVKDIFVSFKKSFFIGSFTTHLHDCLPMWAHYANNHCGICVEYTVNDASNLYKVSYENTRVPIAVIITNIINGYYLEKEGEGLNTNMTKYFSSILHSACIKDKSWKYEDEYRILYLNLHKQKNGELINLDDLGLKISGVYLGINCNKEYGNLLKNICQEQNCNLYKMGINYKNDKFELIYKEYDS
jgi:hypothetical protein